MFHMFFVYELLYFDQKYKILVHQLSRGNKVKELIYTFQINV